MVLASLRGARGLSWPIKAAPAQHLHTPGYWVLMYTDSGLTYGGSYTTGPHTTAASTQPRQPRLSGQYQHGARRHSAGVSCYQMKGVGVWYMYIISN